MNNSGNWLGSILCLLGAFYFGFQYCINKAEVNSAASWERVSGTMETVTMTPYTTTRRGGLTTTTYTPHVAYNFKFKARKYRGETITYPAPASLGDQDAAKFRAKYPEGGIVSVYFNPSTPGQSCLEASEGGTLRNELWYALGLVVLAAILPFCPTSRYDGYGYAGINPTLLNNPYDHIKP